MLKRFMPLVGLCSALLIMSGAKAYEPVSEQEECLLSQGYSVTAFSERPIGEQRPIFAKDGCGCGEVAAPVKRWIRFSKGTQVDHSLGGGWTRRDQSAHIVELQLYYVLKPAGDYGVVTTSVPVKLGIDDAREVR